MACLILVLAEVILTTMRMITGSEERTVVEATRTTKVAEATTELEEGKTTTTLDEEVVGDIRIIRMDDRRAMQVLAMK